MSPLDIDAIEARAKRCASDVPLPECECEARGHAPCCYDCYLAYQAAVGPTFEACGRGDVLALVALARAQAAEDRATADDPLLDGTDGAHPAWWRGHDRAAEMLTAQRDAAVDLLAEVWHEIATGRPPPVSDRTAWLAQVGDVVGAASYCAALDAARATLARERDALRDAVQEYLDARHKALVATLAYLDADPADAAARDAASASEARVTAARTRLTTLVGDTTMRAR